MHPNASSHATTSHPTRPHPSHWASLSLHAHLFFCPTKAELKLAACLQGVHKLHPSGSLAQIWIANRAADGPRLPLSRLCFEVFLFFSLALFDPNSAQPDHSIKANYHPLQNMHPFLAGFETQFVLNLGSTLKFTSI